ncbi:MAG: ABC transporter substrate-binding protein, partial [Acidimicrobiales bacterium]
MGGAASGLFAEAGIEVSIAEPDPGPENIRSVAEGRADYCLTSVAHYLAARARWGNLAARFVAVVVQRSPIAALVRADSGITGVQDLAKATLGGPTGPGMGSLVAQYVAGLGLLGIEPPPIRSMDYLEAPAALGRGEVDAIADYADLLPRMRRRAGTELR